MKTNHILIRKLRKEKKLTQKKLAELTGHTSAMVSYIENEQLQLTATYSPLYAKVLGVPEVELFVFEN